MDICPHCGNKLPPAPQDNYSWRQYYPVNKPVSLGCGTLIIMAIIVAVFSSSGNKKDSNGFRSLRHDVRSLEKKIDNLNSQLSKKGIGVFDASDDVAGGAIADMIQDLINEKKAELKEKEMAPARAEAEDSSDPSQ